MPGPSNMMPRRSHHFTWEMLCHWRWWVHVGSHVHLTAWACCLFSIQQLVWPEMSSSFSKRDNHPLHPYNVISPGMYFKINIVWTLPRDIKRTISWQESKFIWHVYVAFYGTCYILANFSYNISLNQTLFSQNTLCRLKHIIDLLCQ